MVTVRPEHQHRTLQSKHKTQFDRQCPLLTFLSLIPGRRQARAHNLQSGCRNQFQSVTNKILLYFQEDDEGSYSCVAENVLGQTSNVAYLSVNSAQVNITLTFVKPWPQTLIPQSLLGPARINTTIIKENIMTLKTFFFI